LELYEKQQITYDKLAHLLKLTGQTPDEYNIHEPAIILPSSSLWRKKIRDGG
jgi:hypothetical protein